jgi:hypothetical protein
MRDPRYLQGIDCFNRRDFFDAHEIWESLWREESGEAKKFVQGLIQFATALHHFRRRNARGARLLYDNGVKLLAPAGDVFWELPVKKLIIDMTACLQEILCYAEADLPGKYHPQKEEFPVRLNMDLVPTIHLLPPKTDLSEK